MSPSVWRGASTIRAAPDQVVHSLADMIGFRMLMIAAGYEDGNDANRLRSDPVFKMAQDALPSGRDLASQSTICRLENLPDVRQLVRWGGRWSTSTAPPSGRCRSGSCSTSTTPSTPCMAASNCACSMPITTNTASSRSWCSTARAGSSARCCDRPSGRGAPRSALICAAWSGRSATNWPNTRILIRADGHYCGPLVIDWCRANGIDFILGLAPTTTLRKHVACLEACTTARFEAAAKTGKLRRFKEFVDGAASWSRVERIIARVEAGDQGADTRFIVTNLAGGKAKALYEDVYCRRGAAENHIKSWKTHLAADRTSCTRATANQFRLFLHAGAYWLMWGLRAAMPKRSRFAGAQFDTLRLRLIKIAARVVEMKTQIRLHMPTACPDQRILRIVLGRIPRLVT